MKWLPRFTEQVHGRAGLEARMPDSSLLCCLALILSTQGGPYRLFLFSLWSISYLVIFSQWLFFSLFISYFSSENENILRAGTVQLLCYSSSSYMLSPVPQTCSSINVCDLKVMLGTHTTVLLGEKCCLTPVLVDTLPWVPVSLTEEQSKRTQVPALQPRFWPSRCVWWAPMWPDPVFKCDVQSAYWPWCPQGMLKLLPLSSPGWI